MKTQNDLLYKAFKGLVWNILGNKLICFLTKRHMRRVVSLSCLNDKYEPNVLALVQHKNCKEEKQLAWFVQG